MTAVREATLRLDGVRASVTVARHFVRDQLEAWRCEALSDDAELGVSELVANAVRHAGTDLQLHLRLGDDLLVSVVDGDEAVHRPVVGAQGLGGTGRGLRIVAAIARDWGITAVPNGKSVWFRLDPPDRSGADADLFDLGDRRADGATRADRRRRGGRRLPGSEAVG